MSEQQTYIKSVNLSGYKSIKNVSCEFKEGLNIIIGNNGSGKTNVLEFIDKVLSRQYSGLNIFSADINIIAGSSNILSPKHTNSSFKWHAEGGISTNPNDVDSKGITIVDPPKDVFFYIELVEYGLPEGISILSKELTCEYDLFHGFLSFEEEYSKMPLELLFWVRNFLRIENVEINPAELNDDLLWSILNKSFNKAFEEVKASVNRYTPVKDIRVSNSVRIAKIDASTLEFRNIIFEYKVNDEWYPWSALSDGTRRLLYLIFKINGVGHAMNGFFQKKELYFPISLIEEPEIGIHPHQLHLLLNYLQEKSEQQQIIVTTHSPQVLDILNEKELGKIIIAEIDYNNGTSLRHLNEEEIEKAKKYLKEESLLSDYWRFSDLQRSKNIK